MFNIEPSALSQVKPFQRIVEIGTTFFQRITKKYSSNECLKIMIVINGKGF